MKNSKALFGCFFLVFIFSIPGAFADSLSSDTQAGDGGFSEDLKYEGLLKPEGISRWKWNLGYTFTSVTTPGTVPQITDTTNQVGAGLGWEGWKALQTGIGFTYASTPAEAVTNPGGTAYLGYTYKFGSEADDSKSQAAQPKKETTGKSEGDSDASDAYHPSIGARITLGRSAYDHALHAQRSGKALTAVKVDQKSTELELSTGPFEWVFLKFTYTKYSYDRNLNAFLDALDSPLAVRAGLGGLASAVSGFSDRMSELSLSFYPAVVWTLELVGSKSISAIDGTTSLTGKVTLSRELGEAWKIGVGAERDSSSTLRQNAALLSVDYDF